MIRLEDIQVTFNRGGNMAIKKPVNSWRSKSPLTQGRVVANRSQGGRYDSFGRYSGHL
ncbi:hypothetical protein VVATL9824_03298 [Vibrio vulnificus]|nr:hypothetical protein VVATL9824_03298 [Vibrio vulnificus]